MLLNTVFILMSSCKISTTNTTKEKLKKGMLSINCKINQLFFIACFGFILLQPQSAFAKCGGVDYSWGADALSNAHDFAVTMMLYVVYLLYAIASIVAIIGALQIYIKMNTGLGMSM